MVDKSRAALAESAAIGYKRKRTLSLQWENA
jgi:hypothetical protein